MKFMKLRKMLMQRDSNKFIADDEIDEIIESFNDFDPLLDWKFRPVCGCELKGMEGHFYNVKHNILLLYMPLINRHCYISNALDEDMKQYVLLHIVKNLHKFQI